jgi:peptidyl-prolyl cis-trans isomerase C
MSRTAGMLVPLFALVLGSAPLPTASAAGVAGGTRRLAIVGSDTLTIADLDTEVLASLSKAKQQTLPNLNSEDVLRRLIQNRLLEQEGYRIGADQAPAVRNQVHELIRLKSVTALLDSISAPPSGMVKASPDSMVGMAGTLRRYSHILVKEEAVAAALRDSVTTGVPFADLARRHSLDGTAAAGGDLGYAAEGTYLDDFEKAAGQLALDQISEPVHTQFGWHLIKLTGSKADTLKSRAMAEAIIQAREGERRTAAVERYVDSLKTGYGVTINDSLLASLDYASKDPAVQKQLQTSQAVLTVLPTGKLTVRGLTRNIRFKYFHGLEDRDDAQAIRDQMFREWVTEALLSHEAAKLGFDHEPGILTAARMEERVRIREEVLDSILRFEFKPSEEEIRGYYGDHLSEFVPEPRVKVLSVLTKDADTAKRFRDEMDRGAGLKWLADRSPGEVDSIAPFPAGWIDADAVGLKDRPPVKGTAVGPMELPGGWALAEILAVEQPEPTKFDDCKDKVVQAMKGHRVRQALQDALSRLESATEIRIEQGATDAIAERIKQFQDSLSEGGESR